MTEFGGEYVKSWVGLSSLRCQNGKPDKRNIRLFLRHKNGLNVMNFCSMSMTHSEPSKTKVVLHNDHTLHKFPQDVLDNIKQFAYRNSYEKTYKETMSRGHGKRVTNRFVDALGSMHNAEHRPIHAAPGNPAAKRTSAPGTPPNSFRPW